MTPLEQLQVALIRTLNRAVIRPEDTDRDLLAAFGRSALPFAEGLLGAVEAVVAERVEGALAQHWETWHQDQLT